MRKPNKRAERDSNGAFVDDRQRRGTAEPMPGKCGAKIRKTNPPRYCAKDPLKGKDRCQIHGGKSFVGPAAPGWENGRASKFRGLIPENIRRHLDAAPLASIASSRQEIARVDARVAEILERTREHDPVAVHRATSELLRDLRRAVETGETDAALGSLDALGVTMDELGVEAANWQAILQALDTRDKLSRTEIQYQRLLSERILLEHVDTFIRALVAEAKDLPVEREVLSRYVSRVIFLGRAITSGNPDDKR